MEIERERAWLDEMERQKKQFECRRQKRGCSKGLAVGGGLGGIVLILIVAFLGGDPGVLLEGMGGDSGSSVSTDQPYQASQEEEELADFVSVVLADSAGNGSIKALEQAIWMKEIFSAQTDYKKLV